MTACFATTHIRAFQPETNGRSRMQFTMDRFQRESIVKGVTGSAVKHLQLTGKPGAKRTDIRASILNPAKLSAELQLEICMSWSLGDNQLPVAQRDSAF